MEDILPMGARLIELKFKGMPNSVVIPHNKPTAYLRHFRCFRSEDLFSNWKPNIEWRRKWKFYRAFTMDGQVDYVNDNDDLISFHAGHYLREQFRWGAHDFPNYTVEHPGDHVLTQAVLDNNWIFAKTMPKNPHEYALRKEWVDDTISFDELVLLIRQHGYTQYWHGTPYRAMNIGGHFYWTMGATGAITILINRKVGQGNS